MPPSKYIADVKRYSESSALDPLFQGGHFSALVSFLRKAHPVRQGSISLASNGGEDEFITFFRLVSDDLSPCLEKVRLPLFPHVKPPNLMPSETGVIFLNGYPSPSWLAELGATYNVDPEFFQRHLRFLQPGNEEATSAPPLLPCFQSCIFQMSVTTVGHHNTSLCRNVGTKRAPSEDMAQYLEGLQKGVDWKPNDSIVQ